MNEQFPIKMKKTGKSTNPAKSPVLKASTDSDLSRYIREIAKYPALSTEEEKEVARKAKAGDENAKKEDFELFKKTVYK